MAQPKEQWGSRIGVILAVAGSAVGLGNFLRFPGNAAANGGGAFMIPYFFSLIFLGIPLAWAEWNMGRYAGTRGFHSCPGVFNLIWRNPLSKYIGAIGLIIPLVIYMFYVVIEAWCLGYAWHYFWGDIITECGKDPEKYNAFFNSFVGMGSDGAIVKVSPLTFAIVITFILNFILIFRGVTKGIETFCKVAMPFMVLAALCVLARVLTLPANPDNPAQNIWSGLGFMWNPDFSSLLNAETWLAAAGQIFFSISVGFGIIVNYSSYLRKDDDIVLSGLTAATTNEFFEVCLGGLITLPAAVIFLGTTLNVNSTFALGFQALPVVFANMGWGRVFGFIWFFMLFLAAMTSSLSMLQPVIAFFEEGFNLPRKASVALLGFLSFIGAGIVAWFSQNLVALDTFDFWVGTALIFVLAMIQVMIYSYVFGDVFGWKKAMEKQDDTYMRRSAGRWANLWRQAQAHSGAHMRIPAFFTFVLKYVSPLFLLTIFVAWCVQQLPGRLANLNLFKLQVAADRAVAASSDEAEALLGQVETAKVALGSLGFIAALLVLMIILIHIAAPAWEKRIADEDALNVERQVSR